MRFSLPYHWCRVMGISGLFLAGYIVVIGVFGNVNISPLLPTKLAAFFQQAWPRLPFFCLREESVNGGKVIYYTVSTRRLTPLGRAPMKGSTSRPIPRHT